MLKSYQAGIGGMRWIVSPRDDAAQVLQYGLRPINGGALDWFDVPTEVAHPALTTEQAACKTCTEVLNARKNIVDGLVLRLLRQAHAALGGNSPAERSDARLVIRMFLDGAEAAPTTAQEAEPAPARADIATLCDRMEAAQHDYAENYYLDDGEHAPHYPTEFESLLIVDALAGLLADEEWSEAYHAWDVARRADGWRPWSAATAQGGGEAKGVGE